MATGWATANGQWSYFEKSGAMVADRAVPASDGKVMSLVRMAI